MDLYHSLDFPQHAAAYRTPQVNNFGSSQTNRGAASSSALHFPSSQPPMSSQGFSVSQNMPNGLDPLSIMERPPSVGQDVDGLPPSGQQQAQRISFHHINTQNENRVPEVEHEFRSYSQSSKQHDDLHDFSDEDEGGGPGAMVEWEKDNAHHREPKIFSATVPRSTGEWRMNLQTWCNARRLRPDFDYEEGPKNHFTATLAVNGSSFRTTVPLASKKLAQEEVCRLALAGMPALDEMEGVQRQPKQGKKRKSGEAGLQHTHFPAVDRSEDWISLLNNHCLQNKSGHPIYDDTFTQRTAAHFWSQLTIAEQPNEPFKTEGTGHKTKKDARTEVAKMAIVWLRGEGSLSDTTGKKQRLASWKDSTMAGQSVGARFNQLIKQLGFKSPKFDLRRSTLPSGQPLDDNIPYYDIHADFDERDYIAEPSLRGPQGVMRHCVGQKRAKEESYVLLVALLGGIKERRLAAM